MPEGTLEVLLVSAKGLEDADFCSNTDAYVILKCRSQEQKSTVASGQGSDPEWNEAFVFNVTEGVIEVILKILDSDTGTADDFLGEATIPLEPVFEKGNIPPTSYNVVKGEEFCGEIRVSLTFTPSERRSRGFAAEKESFGGWKQSEAAY